MTQNESAISKIQFWILKAGVFILPIFFLPFTLNTINFNKQFLFYLITALLLFSWLLGQFINKKFIFYKTVFDIPIAILWVSFLLSTIFSSDKQLSFFGEANTFNYSFLLHTSLTIFYFMFVQIISKNFRKVSACLDVFVLSMAFAAAYFLISKWFPIFPQVNKYIGLNLTSTLNTLFIITLCIPTVFSLSSLMKPEISAPKRILNIVVLIFSIAAIFSIGFKAAMIPLALSLGLLLIFSISKSSSVKYFWATATFALLIISIIFSFINIPAFITFNNLPAEISLSGKLSFQIAKNSVQKNTKTLLLGEGPSLFSRLFSLYKAAEFNQNNPYWSSKFSQPKSTILGIAAENGLLNLILIVFLILSAVYFSIKAIIIKNLSNVSIRNLAALGIFATLSASMFLYGFQFILWFAWWLMLGTLAIIFTPQKANSEPVVINLIESPQHNLGLSFFSVLIFIGFITFGAYLGKLYLAEVAYAKAMRENENFSSKIAFVEKAINYRNTYHQYRLTAAELSILEALRISGSEKSDREKITELYNYSILQARAAATFAPKSVEVWQVLSMMYGYSLKQSPDAASLALDALQKAIALEPNNPIFYNQIANVYAFQNKDNDALASYRKAVELKSDLLLTYYNASSFFLSRGKIDDAIATMEFAFPAGRFDQEFLLSLADLYTRRRKPEDLNNAVKLLESALRIKRQHNTMLMLGYIYELQNKIQDAIKTYRLILNEDSGNGEAQARLLKLTAAPPSNENAEKINKND